jgi:hypothetical protein
MKFDLLFEKLLSDNTILSEQFCGIPITFVNELSKKIQEIKLNKTISPQEKRKLYIDTKKELVAHLRENNFGKINDLIVRFDTEAKTNGEKTNIRFEISKEVERAINILKRDYENFGKLNFNILKK